MNEHDYRVGDEISYRPMGGGYRRVRVLLRDDAIKNGEAGFSGTLLTQTSDGDWIEFNDPAFGVDEVWGYDRQIIRIEKRSDR